jgi:hypothetical protein
LLEIPAADRPEPGRLGRYDPDAGVLITAIAPGATDLRHYHGETGQFPMPVAAALGAALARLHRLPVDSLGQSAGRARPLALALHRPAPADYHALSAGGLELVEIIQAEPGMGLEIERLDRTWEDAHLIHGELKLAHCIVVANDGQAPELQLIDWELAGTGDRAWDLGSVIGAYLGLWLSSIRDPGAADPGSTARLPLAYMQPYLGKVWRAYRSVATLDQFAARALLQRALRFAAVRLIQTAVEELQAGARLTSTHILLLQLSANLLAHPVASLPGVFGCSIEEALVA